jgi:hypothetical protein
MHFSDSKAKKSILTAHPQKDSSQLQLKTDLIPFFSGGLLIHYWSLQRFTWIPWIRRINSVHTKGKCPEIRSFSVWFWKIWFDSPQLIVSVPFFAFALSHYNPSKWIYPSTYSFKMVHSSSPNAPLSCSVHSARSSYSCLSAQLANAPRQARETFTVSAAKSFNISPEDEQEDKMRESVDQHSEPPLSIHDGSGISQQDSQEFPLRNCFIRLDSRRLSRISPLAANSNLDPSPLTDSSTKVMEREYDRDTWRMYERIQSARSSTSSRSGGGTLPDSKAERGHCLSVIQSDCDDSSCSSYSEHLFTANENHNESDTMFELDL